MPGACEPALVPRATHLFEEPGTLERAAELARDWFIDHLGPSTDKSGEKPWQRRHPGDYWGTR